MEKEEKANTDHKAFDQRLDFYWQYMAVYAIALIIYSLLNGSIKNGELSLYLKGPIVILLSIFVVGSIIGLLFNWYKKRSIIIYKDAIVFKNRFREKRYAVEDIIRIAFGKIRASQIRRSKGYRVIKLKVKNRRRVLKIRPGSYWNDRELINELSALKKRLK